MHRLLLERGQLSLEMRSRHAQAHQRQAVRLRPDVGGHVTICERRSQELVDVISKVAAICYQPRDPPDHQHGHTRGVRAGVLGAHRHRGQAFARLHLGKQSRKGTGKEPSGMCELLREPGRWSVGNLQVMSKKIVSAKRVASHWTCLIFFEREKKQIFIWKSNVFCLGIMSSRKVAQLL